MTPLVSILIPTYGREQILCDTLADVLKQNYSAFEVIVIDQTPAHEPATQAYLEQLVAAQQIQLFRVPWASLPGARNYGARRARGEFLLFIDDDVQMPEGCVAAHVQVYLERPDVGAVAGRVLDRMKLADFEPGLRIEDLPPEAHDPAIAWYHLNLVHTVKPQPVITARGCNMSFRREIFATFNLWFDERFGGSAVREESDFCLRLRRTGYQIWYAPDAVLVHLGERTGGCHDISERSLQYQITFYHNHFLMGLKNLTPGQALRLFAKLFDCHVLGNPPCNKGGSPLKVILRGGFYGIGCLRAIATQISSLWNDGQIYSRQDERGRSRPTRPATIPLTQPERP